MGNIGELKLWHPLKLDEARERLGLPWLLTPPGFGRVRRDVSSLLNLREIANPG
jgi:hypothetical protein